MSAESFGGLGTKEKPFSGVIVGASQNTTVALTGTNENKDSFGGLIAYSRGSVVKDLIVDYSRATITMQAESLPGTRRNPFFGGVVGYCMGGDTIIDHVSVNYGINSVTFSGTYPQTIAAGGYVGLVGGATHVTKDTDYEKTGGGVVFRNMDGTSNTFTVACTAAAAANKTVNMVKKDRHSRWKNKRQMVEIILKKVSPALYQALGVFLPLITTNCCILGVTILVIQKNYDLLTGVVYAFSTALGFALALIVFAGIREQLSLVNIPKGMRGMSIALVTAGLLAMAFMGFSGVDKGLAVLFGL